MSRFAGGGAAFRLPSGSVGDRVRILAVALFLGGSLRRRGGVVSGGLHRRGGVTRC